MRRMSTVGRPRMLTAEQNRQVVELHDAYKRWKAQHKSVRQLAKEFGVAPTTVHDVIRRRDQYKRPPRSDRAAHEKQAL